MTISYVGIRRTPENTPSMSRVSEVRRFLRGTDDPAWINFIPDAELTPKLRTEIVEAVRNDQAQRWEVRMRYVLNGVRGMAVWLR